MGNSNMPPFKICLFGLLFISTLALESKCPSDAISKLVVCYYNGDTSITDINVCNCTHLIFTSGIKIKNNSITAEEDVLKYLNTVKERKANMSAIFTLEAKPEDTAAIFKSENKSSELINEISGFLQNTSFDGIELNFNFNSNDSVTKESCVSFVKDLSKKLSSSHSRTKRESYDVFEKLQDDITTAAYTTQSPKNSTSKTQSIKRKSRKLKENSRKIRENHEKNEKVDYIKLEEAINDEFSGVKLEETTTLSLLEKKKFLLFVRLSVEPEIIAKKLDLKALSRYFDYLIIPTHNLVSSDEEHTTYHPSRLMGLSDMLNTDSILDLLTGMGALKSKIVITMPATVLKFQLKDESKNTPRSPSLSEPQIINQSQLCSLFHKSNWTVERDEDLTAPYAFSKKTWLAFEDDISVNVKGKYILLRDLAGGAIYPIDADLNVDSCSGSTKSKGGLVGNLHKVFESLERKPRALVLESLQDEIHDISYTNIEGGVKVSEYRIVRIVDHSGAVHVIRKNTKTQFECSRQGYFSHPLGCNKFYRCVKFDQYSDEFTVFEYDCPAGLAFDERWEVCVWPGSLPNGAPCTGSSEIAPVPRSHFQCPNHEGYFADPENCRWFFACLDHARDGITPLTAYEFRCPFGLVFSEQKLACDWPWLVGSCGNQGAGIHLASFINGGNLEASFGQFSNSDVSFTDFGKKFKSTLKAGNTYNSKDSYEGSQTAGFGYIASQFDDYHNRESFASFPDYEISGGRILNKGGVVLNQNVAGISGSSAGFIKTGINEVNNVQGILGATRNSGGRTGYYHQTVVPFVDDTLHSSQIKLQNSESTLGTSKAGGLEISGISSGGQLLHQQNPITSKPYFSSISLDHLNDKELSKNSQHSVFVPTEQLSVSHGVVSNQVAVSPVSPVVSSTPGPFTSSGFVSSSHVKTASVSTPFESFAFTSKPELYNIEKLNQKQGKVLNSFARNQQTVLSGGSSGAQVVNKLVSVPVVTSRPNVESTGFIVNSYDAGNGQSLLSKGSSVQNTLKITGQSNEGNVFAGVSQGVPAVQINTFETGNQGQHLVSENIGVRLGEVSSVTATPSIYISTPKQEISLPEVTLSQKLNNFSPSVIDQKISDELKLLKPQSSYAVPTVSSQTVHAVSQTTLNRQSNHFTNKVPVVTAKPDFQLLPQVGTKLQGLEGKSEVEVSVATPQPNTFNYYGQHNGGVSFGYSGATPAVENSEAVKGFTKSYFDLSHVVPESNIYSAKEGSFYGQKETSREKISYTVPVFTSEIKAGSLYGQKTPESKFSQNIQSGQLGFNQQYSYGSSIHQSGNQFTVVQPSGGVSVTKESIVDEKTSVFAPKAEQSNILTEISIEQQPIVPLGSITSTNDHKSSTPRPHFFSQNNLFGTTAVSNLNINSVSPQSEHVTTPVPIVSITPPSRVTYLPNQQSSNFRTQYSSKYSQSLTNKPVEEIKSINPPHVPTFVNLEGSGILSGKSNTQETIKPLPPIVQVTTSIPLTYKEESIQKINSDLSFLDKNNGYLSPITTKTQTFGSVVQQNSPVPVDHFVGGDKNLLFNNGQPVINQQVDFIKTKPSNEEERLQYIQQVPVSVTTALPEYKQKVEQHLTSPVSTIKPFTTLEKLTELEISKSVELNPSQFFQSLNENQSPKPLVIQQQPLHLLSQKTIPVKQIIQPFKQPEQTSFNSFGNKYEQQYVFQQNAEGQEKDILKQKEYSSSTVTYQPQLSTVGFTTDKTNIGGSNVHSVESNKIVPGLPLFETSQISYTGSVDTKNSGKSLFTGSNEGPQSENIFSSKVNLLLPTSTELPQYTQSHVEELSVRTHSNFDSQRINTFSSTPAINVFIQPETPTTSKPAVTTFETPGRIFHYNKPQNPSTGNSRFKFDSRRKYPFNPNIEIPEPPKEYILQQNRFTSAVSDFSTTAIPYQSKPTDSVKTELKETIYLPSAKENYKGSVISSSNSGGQEVGQVFDEFGGKFGQVINSKNGKVNSQNIKSGSKLNQEGLSGQYRVSSTTRPRSRGRQYHGGITSGLKATNKYEEYEIDKDNDSQRSYNSRGGKDSDESKTTIDLKNLKVDKNKKTVIVVSQVSDANPLLIGKLAGQCSCQSNMIEIRNKKNKNTSRGRNNVLLNQQQYAAITNEFMPPYESDKANIEPQATQGESSTSNPQTVIITNSNPTHVGSFSSEQSLIGSSTTSQPELLSSTLLSSLGPDGVLSITPKTVLTNERNRKKQFRGRTRYFPPASSENAPGSVLTVVPASEIASTYDYSILKEGESRIQNEITGGNPKVLAGAAFDRYGPGGWRGFDETLQGSVDCKRPGLFRHPKYCNKFYACNYDPWKERYTLHVFNCPIHLTYDSSISACNWPVRGPACADDNLLV